MHSFTQTLIGAVAGSLIALAVSTPVAAQQQIPIANRFADVNGTRLHYLIAGKGDHGAHGGLRLLT